MPRSSPHCWIMQRRLFCFLAGRWININRHIFNFNVSQIWSCFHVYATVSQCHLVPEKPVEPNGMVLFVYWQLHSHSYKVICIYGIWIILDSPIWLTSTQPNPSLICFKNIGYWTPIIQKTKIALQSTRPTTSIPIWNPFCI